MIHYLAVSYHKKDLCEEQDQVQSSVTIIKFKKQDNKILTESYIDKKKYAKKFVCFFLCPLT